jgi:hypothetical protein
LIPSALISCRKLCHSKTLSTYCSWSIYVASALRGKHQGSRIILSRTCCGVPADRFSKRIQGQGPMATHALPLANPLSVFQGCTTCELAIKGCELKPLHLVHVRIIPRIEHADRSLLQGRACCNLKLQAKQIPRIEHADRSLLQGRACCNLKLQAKQMLKGDEMSLSYFLMKRDEIRLSHF